MSNTKSNTSNQAAIIGRTGSELRARILRAVRDYVTQVAVPTEEQCRSWVMSETHDKGSGYGGYWCLAPVEEVVKHRYPTRCPSAACFAISRNWRPKLSDLRRVCDLVAGLS